MAFFILKFSDDVPLAGCGLQLSSALVAALPFGSGSQLLIFSNWGHRFPIRTCRAGAAWVLSLFFVRFWPGAGRYSTCYGANVGAWLPQGLCLKWRSAKEAFFPAPPLCPGKRHPSVYLIATNYSSPKSFTSVVKFSSWDSCRSAICKSLCYIMWEIER